MQSVQDYPVNTISLHLFNDPFIGVYDFTVRDDLAQRYADAAEQLGKLVWKCRNNVSAVYCIAWKPARYD